MQNVSAINAFGSFDICSRWR